MTQVENSLRQWDDSIGLPYWNWVDYKNHAIMELPELLRDAYFEINNTKYRNPFYIYPTSKESLNWFLKNNPRQTVNQGYCNYTKQTGTLGLFSIVNPNFEYSLFKQIYHSLFFKSFIAMDLPGEVAHVCLMFNSVTSLTVVFEEPRLVCPFFSVGICVATAVLVLVSKN